MIPTLRHFDLDVRQAELIEQMPCKLAARSRVIIALTAVSREDTADPQLRPENHGGDDYENEDDSHMREMG